MWLCVIMGYLEKSEMNERIKELYLHAFPPSLNDSTVCRMSAEKFAELIVRECISRIEGCAVETSPDDFVKGYNKGVSKVSSQVKQYFGVEE